MQAAATPQCVAACKHGATAAGQMVTSMRQPGHGKAGAGGNPCPWRQTHSGNPAGRCCRLAQTCSAIIVLFRLAAACIEAKDGTKWKRPSCRWYRSATTLSWCWGTCNTASCKGRARVRQLRCVPQLSYTRAISFTAESRARPQAKASLTAFPCDPLHTSAPGQMHLSNLQSSTERDVRRRMLGCPGGKRWA